MSSLLRQEVRTIDASSVACEFERKLRCDLLGTLFRPDDPLSFAALLETILEIGLNASIRAAFEDNPTSGLCSSCKHAASICECKEGKSLFGKVLDQLRTLSVDDSFVQEQSIRVVRRQFTPKVESLCGTNFSEEHMDDLLTWFETSLVHWLRSVLPSTTVGEEDEAMVEGEEQSPSFGAWLKTRNELRLQLFDTYGRHLISQLFAVIVDYPDSAPVLTDLKRCLETVAGLRRVLVSRIQDDFSTRLLHPGIATTEILTVYVNTVRCLRTVDSSGVIVDSVTDSIRQYLRNRADTVRCIISVLTEKKVNKSAGLASDMFFQAADENGNESGNEEAASHARSDWKDWQPDPIDALTVSIGTRRRRCGGGRRAADIIGMLVGIYGSKDLFVKEYRQLLAQRLFKLTSKDLEPEVRYLEMLKVRFGESDLQQCEVMLRDCKDSSRIDDFVYGAQAEIAGGTPKPVVKLKTKVISDQFWPRFREERFSLPAELSDAMEAYKKRYELFKANRTLEWKTSLGSVDLSLEIGNRRVSLNVSPVYAVIIHAFQLKEVWSLEELCSHLQTTQSLLKRRIHWWTAMGVIGEEEEPASSSAGSQSTILYRLCSQLPSIQRVQRHCDSSADEGDDEDEGALRESDVDQLEQYWSYISGLLKSLESLKVERVHSLLRMFASPGQEGPSLETVNAFLQRKVKQQLLVFQGGVYKRPAH